MPDIAPLRPEDPATLGPYTLIGRIGRGGYGVVYLAETAGSDRVAVKLLQTAFAETGGERDRFAREAAAAKQVARFCTAQVLDADIAGDRPYIVSEYVPGPSLQALVTERGPLEGGTLDRLAIGTATALVAIHQAGVVHRDLKPPNVLIGPDGPRVIDFGIARIMDNAATQTGHTLGTPAYMAPEQVTGAELTPAADVFAWAATLVYAANGMPPFGRDSLAVLAHRIVNEPPELGALTGDLRTLVAECLEKDPARRPSASMLLMRLLGHSTMPSEDRARTAIMAEGVTAAAVPETETETPRTAPAPAARPRRWPLALAGAAAAVAVAAGAIAAAVAFRGHDRPPVAQPGRTTTVTASVNQAGDRPQAPSQDEGSSAPAQQPDPTLSVTASGCDLGTTAVTCTVTLRGGGAPLRWTASADPPLSIEPSSGSLNPGETVTVTVTLDPATPRTGGTGTVTITSEGRTHTVPVSWKGPATSPGDPDPSSSAY
jgi:predicted Ser/Thr protein kinase